MAFEVLRGSGTSFTQFIVPVSQTPVTVELVPQLLPEFENVLCLMPTPSPVTASMSPEFVSYAIDTDSSVSMATAVLSSVWGRVVQLLPFQTMTDASLPVSS